MSNVAIFPSPTNLDEELDQNPETILNELIPGFVIHSRPMKTLARMIKAIAPINTTILIHGESGTGKELVAKAIHSLSSRSKKLFIPVNCSSFTPELISSELFGHERGSFTGAIEKRIGVFEKASGGTIFLDEISELPLAHQAKLLRALEEKMIMRVGSSQPIDIDVRVIAASNRDLAEMVREKKFRDDLFYRLNIIDLRIPPLRERTSDIPVLIEVFRRQIDPEAEISEEVIARMKKLSWRGNVRELRNNIERHIRLTQAGINESGKEVSTQPYDLETVEKEHILKVLALNQGNKARSAQVLGIALKTLHNKLGKWGLKGKLDYSH